MRQIQKNKSCKVEPCNKTNKQTNKEKSEGFTSFIFSLFFPTTIALRVKRSATLFITWRTDIPIKTKWTCALMISQHMHAKENLLGNFSSPQSKDIWKCLGKRESDGTPGLMGQLFKVGKNIHYLQTLLLPVQISKQVPEVTRVQSRALGVVLVQSERKAQASHHTSFL